MAVINFHIRNLSYYPTIGGVGTPYAQFNGWADGLFPWPTDEDGLKNPVTTGGDGYYGYTSDISTLSNNTNYVYVLFPIGSTLFSGPSYTSISIEPDTTGMVLNNFLIDSTISYNSPQAKISMGLVYKSVNRNYVILRREHDNFNQTVINVDTTSWEDKNWTVGTFSTFKNEVTGLLARVINSSRVLNGQGVPTYPNSFHSDWNINFWMNQSDGDNHVIVFYPGNDPHADEVIEETV